MGGNNSRPDLPSIERNVSQLIKIIKRREVEMEEYVKDQILMALCIYSRQVSEANVRSKSKANLLGLIELAKNSLETLSAQKAKPEHNEPPGRVKMFTIREYMDGVKEKMTHNDIEVHEYEKVLKTVTDYSHQLDNLAEPMGDQEFKEAKIAFSILFLELFIRTPSSDQESFAVLNKVLQDLSVTKGSIRRLKIKNADADDDQMRTILAKIKEEAGIISDLVDQMKQLKREPQTIIKEGYSGTTHNENDASTLKNKHPKHHSKRRRDDLRSLEKNKQLETGKYRDCLNKINEDLEREIMMTKYSLPAPISLFNNSKIKNLVKELKQIPDLSLEIINSRNAIFGKAMETLHKLKELSDENENLHKCLQKLNDFNYKIGSIIESNLSFEKKRDALHEQASLVFLIDLSNDEVKIKKSEISNRIQGLIIVECRNYLGQVKDMLKQYQTYAQQFAYPTRNVIHKVKRNEIAILIEYLKNVPQGNQYVDESRRLLDYKIHEVLKDLDKRADDNEEVTRCLEFLEIVDEEVMTINGSELAPQVKMKANNESRQKINSVSNANRRVSIKKREIFSKIHDFEREIYSTEPLNLLWDFKTTIDMYENDVQQFAHTITTDAYKQKKKEIITVLENSFTIKANGNAIIDEVKKILLNTSFEISKALIDKCVENAETYKCLESLKSIGNEIKVTGQSDFRQYKEKLNLIKISAKQVEVVRTIQNIEEHIAVEEAKNELIHIKEKVDWYKNSQPIGGDSIDEILFLKENLEDMVEGNGDIDRKKRFLLKEIHQVLQNLDGYVANVVIGKQKSANILDLQSHFDDFNLDAFNFPKESSEFVEVIRKRAEAFEDNVKQYLGTNYSIDYYVIYENLMRLLEELDNLSCQDNEDLLRETIAAMDYIKQLIELLNVNATDD